MRGRRPRSAPQQHPENVVAKIEKERIVSVRRGLLHGGTTSCLLSLIHIYARARLLLLTERGWACTIAAEAAAAETVEGWRSQLDPPVFAQFKVALITITTPGRLRPSW